MQLDYVDAVLIHFPGLSKEFKPENTDKGKVGDVEFFDNISSDIERSLESRMIMWQAMQKCKREDGKVKHIGVSNFSRYHIEKLINDPRYSKLAYSLNFYNKV